jgi:diadenosine tetraphosphatase ApaH/serine/threonine PP2A family protein phosphatase
LTLLAIFADIHSNREAFDACLANARARGAERFVFLGDLVGYGADPGYVVDLVADMRNEDAIVIKGNHDAAIAQTRDTMNAYAREARDWTREQLNAAQKNFLAQLPLTAELGETLFVHAEASRPERWNYITHPFEAERSMRATQKRVTICGHVHRPQLYSQKGRSLPVCRIPETGEPITLAPECKWLAVVGSVGQPRDEIPDAAYALYDDAQASLTFLRAPYDIEAAARKIRAAGLPAILAARLHVGR